MSRYIIIWIIQVKWSRSYALVEWNTTELIDRKYYGIYAVPK